MRTRLPWILVALILAGLAVPLLGGKTWFAFDVLEQHLPWSATAEAVAEPHNLLITDPINDSYPRQDYLQRSLRAGDVPFWNPGYLGGTVHVPFANPVFLGLLLCLPLTWAHDLFLLVNLALAGACMVGFLLRLGRSPAAAALGGVGWMLNGYVAVWLEYDPFPMQAATLAAGFFFLHGWLEKRHALDAWGLAGAVGYGATVGYSVGFHLLEYVLLVLGAYALVHVCVVREARLRRVLGFALLVLAGFVLASATLSAFWVIGQDIQRIPYGFERLPERTAQVRPWYLVTLFFPEFFGSPALPLRFQPREPGQVYQNYSELCLYAGVVPLLLCLFAWLRPKRRGLRFFGATSLFALAVSMGSWVYWPLYAWVPGLGVSAPTRILILFGFGICVLAGFGLDALREAERPRWLFAVAPLLTLVAVALAWFARGADAQRGFLKAAHVRLRGANRAEAAGAALAEHFAWDSIVIGLPLVLGALASLWIACLLWKRTGSLAALLPWLGVALCAVDLGGHLFRYNTLAPRTNAFPATASIDWLVQQDLDGEPGRIATKADDGFLPNAFLPFGLEDVGGYASVYGSRYGKLFSAGKRGSRWVALTSFDPPLIDALNVRYVLTGPKVELSNPKFELAHEGEFRVWANRRVFPRAFWVPEALVVADGETALTRLRTSTHGELRRRVLLEAPVTPLPRLPPGPSDQAPSHEARIEWITRTPDELELELDAAAAGYLVLSDNYHPLWSAWIDGTPAPLLVGNYVMRTLPVAAGRHRVRMRFEPPILVAGWWLGILAWTAFSVLGLWLFARRSAPG